jgi:hypothetical protein
MVIAAAIGAATHRNHPARLRHLVIYFAQSRRHFVGQRTSHNHHITLAGAGARNNSESVEIVARHVGVDHFNRTAGQSEGHRPQAASARPVHHFIQVRHHEAFTGDLTGNAPDHGVLGIARRQCVPVPGQTCGIAHLIYSQSNAPLFHS